MYRTSHSEYICNQVLPHMIAMHRHLNWHLHSFRPQKYLWKLYAMSFAFLRKHYHPNRVLDLTPLLGTPTSILSPASSISQWYLRPAQPSLLLPTQRLFPAAIVCLFFPSPWSFLKDCILPCIMCTFCPNFWGKNKDAHYTQELVLKRGCALYVAKCGSLPFLGWLLTLEICCFCLTEISSTKVSTDTLIITVKGFALPLDSSASAAFCRADKPFLSGTFCFIWFPSHCPSCPFISLALPSIVLFLI